MPIWIPPTKLYSFNWKTATLVTLSEVKFTYTIWKPGFKRRWHIPRPVPWILWTSLRAWNLRLKDFSSSSALQIYVSAVNSSGLSSLTKTLVALHHWKSRWALKSERSLNCFLSTIESQTKETILRVMMKIPYNKKKIKNMKKMTIMCTK